MLIYCSRHIEDVQGIQDVLLTSLREKSDNSGTLKRSAVESTLQSYIEYIKFLCDYKMFLSIWKLQLFVFPPTHDVIIEEITINRSLDKTTEPDDPLRVSRFGKRSVQPIKNIETTIGSQ